LGRHEEEPTGEFHHEWPGLSDASILLARRTAAAMRSFSVVVERDPDTGLYVGHVPGWPGAHSQGESLDELQRNLQEVVAMLLEDGDPKLESEFVGVQTIKVA
jgi:predicted RNase H-like HicB family nuclease